MIKETYQKYLQVEPKDFDFASNYTPIPQGYITICTRSHTPSRIYDYYGKVAQLLNLPIVQIGGKDDYLVGIDYREKPIRQNAFIIENSRLHIGNDSIYKEIAKNKGVKTLTLYSVTPAPQDGEVNLESPRNGLKPSYLSEGDRTINLIKPEDVAEAAFKILGILWEKPFETIKINSDYLIDRIDVVTDFPVQPGLPGKLVCRYDISNNFQALAHFYHLYSAPLLTEDPIDANFLAQFKPKIPQIFYFLDRNYSKEFVKILHSSGIPYELVTSKSGKEFADLKLDLFEFNQVKQINSPDTAGITSEMFFETKRVFLSKGKFYPTHYHLVEGVSFDKCDFKIGAALESKLFLESWPNLYIYKK